MNSLAYPDSPLAIRLGRGGRLLLLGEAIAAAAAPGRRRELIDRCFGLPTLASLRLERNRGLRLRFAPEGKSMSWPETLAALGAAMRAPAPASLPLANAELVLDAPAHHPATIRRAGPGRLTFWRIEWPVPGRLRCAHPLLAHPRVREAVLDELTTLAGVEEMDDAPWRRASLLLRCERPEAFSLDQLLEVLEPAIARRAGFYRAAEPQLNGPPAPVPGGSRVAGEPGERGREAAINRGSGAAIKSGFAAALVNVQLALSPVSDYLLPELRPLTTGLFLVINLPTIRRAFQAVRRCRYNLSVLRAAMGVLTLHQARYTSDSVMTKLLESWPRWSEARRRAAERRFLARLRGYPRRVWVERGNAQAEIPLAGLRPGDAVVLRPGDTVPGDGIVLDGEAGVREGWLTGEPGITQKRAGDRLLASGQLCEGELRMRIDAFGEATVAARLAARYRYLFDRPCPKLRAGRLAEGSAWFSLAGAVAGFFRGGSEMTMAAARPDYLTGPGITEECGELAGILRAGLRGLRVPSLEALPQVAEADGFVLDEGAGPWFFDAEAARANGTVGERLHRLGVRELVLLSGRPPEELAPLAARLGADLAFGNQQAADKAAFLAGRLCAGHKLVYLSHGNPDPLTVGSTFAAVPLSAASAGTREEQLLENAAITFPQPDLEGVIELRRLARATVRRLRRGQRTAVAVNVACLAGALALEWPVLVVVALTNAGTLLDFFQAIHALRGVTAAGITPPLAQHASQRHPRLLTMS